MIMGRSSIVLVIAASVVFQSAQALTGPLRLRESAPALVDRCQGILNDLSISNFVG